ncbi:uncharacterized protein LOC111062401 [Nilaparvata lugens]|uniref:uncharacterized protein LOC111062401 n=1 Tax=Nilaparvata lugens TaxID=108931 RepID=UPI00193CEBBE|nr:uncharacterized protein LOC111062401 [Nilaparvata lugens]
MMETVEVTEHRSNPELLPVQIVSSEGGRVEVISKMAPNPGHMTPDMMTATQYINLHRLPEHMNKVIVTDPISGDLIAHHVDLTSASGGEFAPHAHYYDTEELLAHGLTAEEERRIAAEIVAVQLKQGGGTLVTAQDLLNAKTLTSLSTVSMDGQKAVYIQTVEDVDMHNLQQQENAERGAIMKIYPQQQQEMQVLTRTQSQQPLPPLKKVLSSQSMMIRNKYNETPGIMVELHNSHCWNKRALEEGFNQLEIGSQNTGLTINANKTKYMFNSRIDGQENERQLVMGNSIFERVDEFKYLGAMITHRNEVQDNNSCIKAEHHLEDAAATQQVVMTTTSTPTPTTTTLAPPPHPPPLLAPPPHPPPLTTAHTSASLAPPPLASNHHPPSLATTHNSAPLAPSPHPPSLAPPTDESEEEEDDGESARAASRKSLPHKKRFPRKLKATPTSGARVGAQKTYKCSKCGESFSTQHLLTAHRSVHTGAPIKQRSFNCELCQNKQFATQLKFFEHLKGHYEPAAVGEGVTEGGASNLEMPPIQDANTMIADAKNDHVTQQQQQQQQYVEEQPLAAPVKTELLTCLQCGRGFKRQKALAAHHAIAHAPPPPPLLATPSPQPRPLHDNMAADESVHTGAPIKQRSFNCELCQNKQFATQLKFFEHLKGHYEPAAVGEGVTEGGASNLEMPPIQDANTMIADAKNDHVTQQQQQQQQQQYVEEQPLAAPVKTELLTCLQCGRGFKRQKALAAHHAIAHAPPPPPLLATPSPQPRPLHDNMAADEFSEPEDMMEGIRHVVNMPAVDSGDEEHHLDDKIRWRYQLKASSIYRSIPDMGEMDLQDMHTLQAAAQPLAPAVEEGAAKGVASEKGGEKRPPLTCLECNRVFNHRNSLLYHLRSHSGVRPHQCDICGKGFISGSALKVHMRLHSGAKPYKCEHCNRQFRQWGDLKYHVTSLHSDQKQFQCEYCGKDFARKYSLNVHRRIHTGEKNYECEFCGKSFRASSYLKNHRRIHTGEKPHVCDLCGKPFRVRSDMKRHRRTHTKDQAGNEIIVQGGEEDVDDPRVAPHQAHIVEGEDHSPEIILPDQAPHTPLNLNMRQAGTDGEGGELVYTTAAASRSTHSVDSRDGTLYVWIPAPPHSILSDE